ncbi:penicillin-binding protein 1C [Sphingomonas aquatilis]|uniref:peptidoglycan glycosyltransferase n=1 Tax=Sphingomonas aquatilis TaxID=93063 RepID=A0AAW3TVU8_9SPHN|nr:penicillin-binding protein 1C [Sphingomonas aquatilis]MBB3876816.1 penicillin-binding protein 1C [Sphingomonas aquatilis]MCI4654137.1 penicillin-binding protein 1C [Sphingomonas aquatilis]GEM70765.1 penicillin-binding protein 1C [Sphingomonas aquatilis NBRC 16722]
MAFRFTPRRALALVGVVAVIGGGLDYATRPPPLPDYATVCARWRPSEAWLYDRHGTLIDSARVDFAARRLAWTPLSAIAPDARAAIVRAEDHRFFDHGGVDWLALAGATRARIERQRARGASTLSMQLAGFLSPSLARPGARGWIDKVRQIRAGRALEARWSKDHILEAYLNLAGYRGEAQGIGAAALGLFGKTPASLTRDDALLLAALLPDPRADAATIARRACALSGGADCTRFAPQVAAMLGPARSLALDPGLAPHLSDRLLTKPGLRIITTLDAGVQRMAAAALRRQLLGLGGTRARDGAVVVVDNASGDVLAYVGGIGGASTAPAVDNANAYRQAGSTLKPFLYALGIERRFLTPASILEDSPVQLDTASGLYVPQNYDRGFKGPVSARIALAGSLNVPAVRTLLLVGVEPFRDRLWDLGYRGLVEDGAYYGFSLALGSAEVTLLEQADAYRTLAQGGRWSPLRLTLDQPRVAPRAIVSPAAAWIVGDMISDPNARAATFGLDSALRLPFWAAVKTGTSKAMRDNWCIGYSDRFTVGVWVGNAEGDPMRAVSGTSGAAPVWRDVMLALHARAPGRAPPKPADVVASRVAFTDTREQARQEFFVRGTAQTQVAAAPAEAHRPRFTNPVAGSVYALDPDIPADRQRLVIGVSGSATAHRIQLDSRDLGPADHGEPVMPGPGLHRLRLVDGGGRIVDQILFTVR